MNEQRTCPTTTRADFGVSRSAHFERHPRHPLQDSAGWHRIALVLTLAWVVVLGTGGDAWSAAGNPALASEIRQIVEENAQDLGAGWRDAQAAYLTALLAPHEERPDFDARMEHFRSGIVVMLTRIKPSSRLEDFTNAHNAEARWYVEQLMEGELPSDAVQEEIRAQLKHLFGELAEQTRAAIPEIDEAIQADVTRDLLADCEVTIRSALFPLFRRPLTDEQMASAAHAFATALPRSQAQYRQLKDRGAPVSSLYGSLRMAYRPVFASLRESAAPKPAFYQEALADLSRKNVAAGQRRREHRDSEKKTHRFYGDHLKRAELWGWVFATLMGDPPLSEASKN